MSRPAYSPAVSSYLDDYHREVVDRVRAAVEAHPVVVVGMAWNPHVAKARKALTEAGIDHEYIEIGNYLTGWRPRLAIKLWSGWPTFPQVFVRGTLVGGNKRTRQAIEDGSLRALLKES